MRKAMETKVLEKVMKEQMMSRKVKEFNSLDPI